MVIREAHYGRHSSDMQNPRSTQDQLQALRIVSEACGKASIRTFTDEAVSGSALNNRPGLQALLAAVARGEIDKVRTEALDRLSRDQEDIAHIYKRLKYASVALETLSEGHVTELHIGLKGTMNQMDSATRRAAALSLASRTASPAEAAATGMIWALKANWRSTHVRHT